MTTQFSVPAGAPCWIDLATSDVDRARDFYGQLLGWTAGPGSDEFGGYFMFTKDGVPVAGGMPAPPGSQTADYWGVYLAVDDAARTVQTAAAHGGTSPHGLMPVADLGTMALIDDPGGATIGIWQADTFGGFGVLAEAGAPAWFELRTRGYDTAVDFYRDVFDWDIHVMSDTPQFRYSTLGTGNTARAGIMADAGMLPDGVGGRWSVYFAVADADSAQALVGDLGGAVVHPAEDTPFGRLVSVTDPTGAELKLVGPNTGPAATE